MTTNEIESSSAEVDVEAVRDHVGSLQAQGVDVLRIAALSGIPAPMIDSILRDRRIRRVRPGVAARILEIAASGRESSDDEEAAALTVSTGTLRRLRALVAAGHPREVIAQRMGVPTAVLDDIVDTGPAQVPVAVARNAALVFNDLQLVPGTDPSARHQGLEQGWAPPLAWDEEDIDKEDAAPAPCRPGRGAVVRKARRSLVRELAAGGAAPPVIARELGVTLRTVQRDLRALGTAGSAVPQ